MERKQKKHPPLPKECEARLNRESGTPYCIHDERKSEFCEKEDCPKTHTGLPVGKKPTKRRKK